MAKKGRKNQRNKFNTRGEDLVSINRRTNKQNAVALYVEYYSVVKRKKR